MRFQLQTDYALRTLLFLATHPDELVSVATIASRYEISRHHLVKVANHLVHLGYVEATRGRGGGLRLARAATSIRVGEVVRDFEGDEHVLPCVEQKSSDCLLHDACSLRTAFSEAEQSFHATLDRYRISDFLKTNSELVSILRAKPRRSASA